MDIDNDGKMDKVTTVRHADGSSVSYTKLSKTGDRVAKGLCRHYYFLAIELENEGKPTRMSSLRAVFRILSLVFLIGALAFATLDSIQSVSSSAVELTSLGNAWLNLDPESLTLAEFSASDYIGADIWRPVVAPLLAQPASVVLLVLALLFWMAGYKMRPFAGRFSA